MSRIIGICYYQNIIHMQWVTKPADTHPHPDGVWGTLLLCPIENHSVLETVLS